MQTVPEVEIRGYITEHLPEGAQLSTPTGIKASSEVCRARAVIEQIEAARAAGARALVVTIDSVGGDMQASLSVYRALRRFSEGGGTVIVHVVGMAASSASTIALAGDVVLMAADARFLVHSAVGDPRAVAEGNAAMLAAALERTSTPPDEIHAWLRYQYDPAADRYHCAELRSEAAIAFSWADATATAEAVGDLAGKIAAGAYCSTPRRLALASRAGAVGAIVTDHLAANAVTASKIVSVGANQVTGLGTLATQNATDLNTLIANNVTTIDGGKITTGTIAAGRIDTISLAADHATIGGTRLDQAWFGRAMVMAGHGLRWNTPSTSQFLMSVDSGAKLAIGSWNDTTWKLRLLGVGLYAAGFERMIVIANRADTVAGGSLFSLRSSYSADHGVSGNDLYVDVSLWATYWDGSAWVDAIQHWDSFSSGMSYPAFDIVAVAFNSTSNWFYW